MRLFFPLLFLFPLFSSAQAGLTSSNLPIVIINTNGQYIPDEPKVTAQMQVIYNGPGVRNNLSDPPQHFNGLIGIEMRGSSSSDLSEKKPYAVEIRDTEGNDLDFPLLGMPEESDWAFIAPYSDKTLLRDALIYELARRIMPWAPRTRFVELILNGKYEGVYTVTERIKRGSDRVDISNLEPDETAGNDLTGGYIVKIDKIEGTPSPNWISPYPVAANAWQRTTWQLHYPKAEDAQPEQVNYIQSWITQFESATFGPDFADPEKGFRKYVDVPSFIDFTLLNELAKNVDGYRISTYLHKDRDDKDPLLHAGPVWDFNIAFGNANYCNAEQPYGWQIIDMNFVCGGDGWLNHFFWTRMWQDPKYKKQLRDRWFELRKDALSDEAIYGVLDSLSQVLQESQYRNFQRWPILNVWIWPNHYCCGSYNGHLNYLRDWIRQRLAWMDRAAGELYLGEYVEKDRFDTQIFPSPSLGRDINFRMYLHARDFVQIRIYDSTGRFVTELEHSPELHGESILNWPNTLSKGIYFYEVIIDGKKESSGRFAV